MDLLIWVATVLVVGALLWVTQTGQPFVVLIPVVLAALAVVLVGLYFELGGSAWPYVAVISVVVTSLLPRRGGRGSASGEAGRPGE